MPDNAKPGAPARPAPAPVAPAPVAPPRAGAKPRAPDRFPRATRKDRYAPVTERQVETILRGVAMGLAPEAACTTAGVTLADFQAWHRRHRTGAVSKLTPDVVEKVLQGVRAGQTFNRACEAAHITQQVKDSWIARAKDPKRDPDGRYRHFAEVMRFAEAEAEQRWLLSMEKPPAPDAPPWMVYAWKLERRHPELYARTDRHEVTGRHGGPVQTADARAALAAVLARGPGKPEPGGENGGPGEAPG